MNIFNSLGSNYDFSFVLKSLLTFDGKSNNLKKFLEDKYGGQVTLLYKGRQAIELALKILNLEEDSYVAINGFTCFAVYDAVKKAGLNIEYLDIEKGSLNFSSQSLQKKLNENPKIKVVIIQNTLGYPCKAEEISRICKENEIILIEDLAHSIGTRYEGTQEAGMVGDFVALSFSQDKMIDGISGGALIKRTGVNVIHLEGGIDSHLRGVDTKIQLIDRLYPLFSFLIRNSYFLGIGKILHFTAKKLNLLSRPMDNGSNNELNRLPNWYANLIKDQFEKLEKNLHHRKAISYIYAKSINPKILSSSIVNQISQSSNLRFPIFVNNRINLIQYLESHQIYVSDIWYDGPIAPKKYLSQTDYKNQCPNSEIASDEIVNLPTHINIDEKEAEKISQLINQWLKLQ